LGPFNPRVERVFVVGAGKDMVSKKSREPSTESIARANRQRVAAEQGKQAMADVERQAAAVRENMARLRSLREAEAKKRRELLPDDAAMPAIKKRKPASKSRRGPAA
jgi:hypothetical protein